MKSPAPRLPERLLLPVQAFVRTETAGGIVLLAAAAIALIWANSPVSDSYFDFWAKEVSIETGIFDARENLQHWVNDGLMTIFFLVVGLEIKRELLHGELAGIRLAALPAAAALGGMIVPALLYTALNVSGEGGRGWGIPMATDIAFALGVLALVGNGIPSALRAFLLTLAIVDDIGAIAVIAVFYTDDLALNALTIAARPDDSNRVAARPQCSERNPSRRARRSPLGRGVRVWNPPHHRRRRSRSPYTFLLDSRPDLPREDPGSTGPVRGILTRRRSAPCRGDPGRNGRRDGAS